MLVFRAAAPKSMTLLLYCICEAQAEVAPPGAGVRGVAVQQIAAEGLRCFYSEPGDLGGDAAGVRKDAVDFHRVTHSVFQKAAIIPFRFPTLMKDMAEIAAFLASHAGEYAEALKRLRDAVQMEIRISLAEAAAAETVSGAEYLRCRADIATKLEQAAASCKAAAAYAREWRQRTSRDSVHCFALLRRGEVYNFEQAFRGLRLDAALKAIVSGPWPATEFLTAPKTDTSGTKVSSK